MAKAGSTLTVAAALLAGSMAAASAADLPVKAPMVAPVVAAYDWSGWYAGVGVGGLWGDSRWRDPFGLPLSLLSFVAPQTNSFDSAMVGVHGGYQWHFKTWQNGGIVVGMEYSSNFSLNDNFNGGTACPRPIGFGFVPATTCQTKIDNVHTVGGKLGFTWDRFMLYGQGGWAGGNVLTRTISPVTGLPFDPIFGIPQTKAWHNGWYAGGGIDWVFYQTRGTDWIIGVDYKHFDLGSLTHNTALSVPFPFIGRNVDVEADQIMARLTVKLNGPYWLWGSAPVVAKY
jgi:outer membrane immunogenic protein